MPFALYSLSTKSFSRSKVQKHSTAIRILSPASVVSLLLFGRGVGGVFVEAEYWYTSLIKPAYYVRYNNRKARAHAT